MPRTFALLACLAAVLLLAGCAGKHLAGLPPGFQVEVPPPELAAAYEKLEREGERNWVLNLQSLAILALRHGHRDIAARALDEAILGIEVIYGDSPQARRARSTWFEEESKIYKGDPYERSMVYFYRGILYMQDGEWDNARACFRSAQIQDAFVEEQQHQGDWALFDYLAGVCEVQRNNLDSAADAFGLANSIYSDFGARYSALRYTGESPWVPRASLNPHAELPPFTPRDNLLVITQHGRAPRKIAEGRYGEYQAYRPGGRTDSGARVLVNGLEIGRTQTVDSVYYQAVTRGGREVDRILGRQATFKGAASDVGEVGVLGGGFLVLHGLDSRNEGVALVGLAAMAAGAVSYGISALIKPQADLRAMRTLPDSIAIASARLAPGSYEVGVEYLAPVSSTTGSASDTVTVRIDEGRAPLKVLLSFPPPEAFILYPPETAGQQPEPVDDDWIFTEEFTP